MNSIILDLVILIVIIVYARHIKSFNELDQLAQDIYKTKNLSITMAQASNLSKNIQVTTGVIIGNTVTAFDKKQLTLKIEASDYTITVILDKKRDVVRFDVKNRGKVDD